MAIQSSTSRSGRIPALLGKTFAGLLCVAWAMPSMASDHNDGPSAANDQGLDIADLYAFMDPGFDDPSLRDNVILILTFRGFITPGEAENMNVFQDNARFRFDIENTGDAAADRRLEVTFSDRQGFREPQIATIKLKSLTDADMGQSFTFTAPTTIAVSDNRDPFFPPNEGSDFTVTTDPVSGISFFAGQTDDPFFLDVPGEIQFRESLLEAVEAAGGPGSEVPVGGFGDTNRELRGRDTFAGYNILSIALSVPKDLLLGPSGSVIGVQGLTDRVRERRVNPNAVAGAPFPVGPVPVGTPINVTPGPTDLFQVDRQGFPVINVVLIDYARKRDYNRATTVDDAGLAFAGEIVARLMQLGTSASNIDVLAKAVVLNGDQLRLDTSIPNPGPEGGNTADTGFLNTFGTDALGNTVPTGGRRLVDNAPDALVNIISNQQYVGANALGGGLNIGNTVSGVPDVDLVPANDDLFRDTFPFLSVPNQPQFPGADEEGITIMNVDPPVLDDRTRN